MEYHHKGSPVKRNSKPRLGKESSWLQVFEMQVMLFTRASLNLGPPSTEGIAYQHSKLWKND
jgi:hypothetical protein